MRTPYQAVTTAISALARVLTGRRRRLFMWHRMRVWPAKPVSAVWVSLLGMLYEPSTARHAGVGLVSNAERCAALAEPTKNELVHFCLTLALQTCRVRRRTYVRGEVSSLSALIIFGSVSKQ